ncbi:MAG: hypothetical protein ACLTXS_19960 [[Clostridium] symbiosum]
MKNGNLEYQRPPRFHAGGSHPIAGDYKYGDPAVNREARDKYAVQSQMLHAWRLVMPKELREPLAGLGGREFTAKPPEEFMRMTAGMPGYERFIS